MRNPMITVTTPVHQWDIPLVSAMAATTPPLPLAAQRPSFCKSSKNFDRSLLRFSNPPQASRNERTCPNSETTATTRHESIPNFQTSEKKKRLNLAN